MTTKRSFRDKLADPGDLPRVQPLTGAMRRRHGAGTPLFFSPRVSDRTARTGGEAWSDSSVG